MAAKLLNCLCRLFTKKSKTALSNSNKTAPAGLNQFMRADNGEEYVYSSNVFKYNFDIYFMWQVQHPTQQRSDNPHI